MTSAIINSLEDNVFNLSIGVICTAFAFLVVAFGDITWATVVIGFLGGLNLTIGVYQLINE